MDGPSHLCGVAVSVNIFRRYRITLLGKSDCPDVLKSQPQESQQIPSQLSHRRNSTVLARFLVRTRIENWELGKAINGWRDRQHQNRDRSLRITRLNPQCACAD